MSAVSSENHGVSVPSNARSAQENESEPPKCANTTAALTSSWASRQEADVETIHPQSDNADRLRDSETIGRLKHLLAEAIDGREWAMNRVLELEAVVTGPGMRHWFVPDGAGYCQACGLDQRNARHARKAAAV